MNPLGNMIAPVNPIAHNIAETLRFARSFQSPDAFMQELQRQNPQMAQQLAHLAQTMKNPMQVAQQMLAQQGITPQQILSQIAQK